MDGCAECEAIEKRKLRFGLDGVNAGPRCPPFSIDSRVRRSRPDALLWPWQAKQFFFKIP